MALVIEVSLLGPPRVERNGRLVAFDTRKAVAVLALLAVTDRPQTRASLAELLWPGHDPEHARGALRRTLSSLRSVVGGDLLEATSDHVRLVKGADIAVDVDRFRDSCERRELEKAIELYRGDLLEGFVVRDSPDFEQWVQVEAEGLRRRLLGVLVAVAEEREKVGDLAGAVEAARRCLSLDVMHEPAHRSLIRLHALAGNRAAALTQYRECVRTLSRELGVAPLRETTELYESILRGSFPQTVTSEIPGVMRVQVAAAPFVGRTIDLAHLRAEYDAIDANGRVVVIEGEAGIGKSRTAHELCSWVRRRGGRVLAGRAYEDEAGLAYAPMVEALQGSLSEDRRWLEDLSDSVLGEAVRLLPELATGRTVVSPPVLEAPAAETRFTAGLWDTLVAGAAAGGAPGVLFIDDVHWADDATLRLLGYGVRRLAGRPLLLLLCWRAPYDHAFRRDISRVTRGGGGVILELERLDEEATRKLARQSGHEELTSTVSRQLWELSEGVPLLVLELLRAGWSGDTDTLPGQVRDVLRGRLDRVSEIARQVLAAAAVLGRSFDSVTVQSVSGRSDEETVSALEEVVGRGLVIERRLTYDFAHELLRRLVYDDTSLARRRLLHGRAARVPGTPVATVARHLQQAGREAEAAAAFRSAGDHAREVFAHATALDHLRTALALGHPERAELQTAVGDLQTLRGDYVGALLAYEAAAAEGDPAELGALEQRIGRLQHRCGDNALAQAHLEAALALAGTGDETRRASVTADLSLVVHASGDTSRARALAHDARAMAQQAGDARALCQVHNLLGMLATVDGDATGGLVDLERGRVLAEQIGDADLNVAVLNNLALAHDALGDRREAIHLTEAALDLSATTGDRHHEAALHNNLADLLHAAGREDEAMRHLKSAVEILGEIDAREQPRPGIWKLVRW
jgi:DNA-binding SARP family transcriptional activator/tetratricopeptide (TPR) repeat protein